MKKTFFRIWTCLVLGLTTVVFNSCSKDDDSNPDDANTPTIIAVTGISLDKTTLELTVGGYYTLTATVTPDNATDKIVVWTSSDDAKATVVDGKVTAVAAGMTTITAQAGNQTEICIVTVKNDEGVIINDVRWATRNIDAPGTFTARPEDAGMFYQWNRKIGWSVTNPMISSNGGTVWNDNYPTGSTWEKANDPSPTGWRVPTITEIQNLLNTDKVTRVWTSQNGKNGYQFTDKTTGNFIFLPAAGYRYYNNGTLNDVDSNGSYWSSTRHLSGVAYGLVFDSGYIEGSSDWNSIDYRYGISLRPVAE